MIDLSKLKVGDTVVFKSGSKYEVTSVELNGNYFYVTLIYPDKVFAAASWTYRQNGTYCGADKFDIIEIIPKESEVNCGTDVTKLGQPKRFVDLLAEGEEFIADCNGYVWKSDPVRRNVYRYHKHGAFDFRTETLAEVLFNLATPAQNPEKKKRVVHNFILKSTIYQTFTVSPCKYESLEDCQKDYVNHKAIRLIEESREEIEE